ncbi:CRTAC1 family protein [Ulvibacterium marinum]|uniref:CRTAC1 family protein n=1 Tax=Ulvibacterium marinum TaxID=2419782 RepID=UPI0024940938|nr:CRTAC1 family protein [Ulvibacterium marinum]
MKQFMYIQGYGKQVIISTVLAAIFLTLSLGYLKMDGNLKTDDKEAFLPPGNLVMAEELKALAENADPVNNYMLNEARAVYYYKNHIRTGKNDSLSLKLYTHYLEELINAGFVEKAITEIENHLTDQKETEVTSLNKELYGLLGLAYLQKGEEENCVEHHTVKSCIIPIEKEGLHHDTSSAEKAILIYTKILKGFPEDLQAQWLLNLAYMTLGDYPEGVPKNVRIPDIAKTKTTELPEFRDMAMQLGVHTTGLAGGVIGEDFDNDGLLDIMVSSYGLNDPLRLFRNTGKGKFEDISQAAGLKGLTGGLNLLQADYNNDGFSDVLVLRGAWLGDYGKFPNSLLRNNGDTTFTDVTQEAGLLSYFPTQTAAWADFNKDGFLDLFIGNESPNNPHPCELYVNKGDGTFEEVARHVGISVVGVIKGAAWGDINNDGLPDLYLSDLSGNNRLFLNRCGTSRSSWQFVEIAAISGVQEPYHSFPTWFWDFNNDGFEDIFVSGYALDRMDRAAEDEARVLLGKKMMAEAPRLYKNNGDNSFTEVSKAYGIHRPLYTMGCNYGDLDNDGFLDFYLGTGTPNLNAIIPNRMYRNIEGKSFEDVTFQGGFGHIQKGHGIAFFDYDNDGDQDIYEVLGGAVSGDTFQNILFENRGNTNAWITLRLVGKTANRSAIGARIKITVKDINGGERLIYTTVSSGGSFGASSLQQEIGLGEIQEIKEVKIWWPDDTNTVSTFQELRHNSFVTIHQDKNGITYETRNQ